MSNVDLEAIKSHRHAVKPRVAGLRIDLHVRMHFAHIRVAVLLGVELWTSEKTRKEVELLEPRVRDPMTAQMKESEQIAFRFLLDDVVKYVNETAHTLLFASTVVERRRCTSEGTRLLNETRKFVASLFFDELIALGWSQIELFGIAPDAPKTHLGTWGLVVTQILLLPGSCIETITEECAIFRTRENNRCIWPRFRSEINECVLWWECPRFFQSNER